MSSPVFRVVGLCGSLRAKSMNAALLRYAATTFPSYVRYDEAHVGSLPLYNEDLEVNRPQEVKDFAALVAAADGVLFASPEYNFGITGVLKNAIDWASRAPRGEKPGSAPLMGKPYAILGGSGGMMGSGRAQYPLRQSLVFLGGPPVIRPEVFVRFSDPDLWDEAGELKHPGTRKILGQLTASLVDALILYRQREETLRAFKAKL